MKRFSLRLLLVVSALPFLGSCALLSDAGDSPDGPPGSLAEARELWQSKGYENYRMDFERLCYCAPRLWAATVYVQADTVHHFDNLKNDGEPVTGKSHNATREDFLSVEELFELIESTSEANKERAEYDAELGYPRSVTVGNFAVDAGTAYDLKNVRQID